MCRVDLKRLVNLVKLSQPDLVVVSSEGMKFPTWRLLLAIHSPLLARLLQTLKPAEEGLLAISLPLPFTTVSSMLAILSEGGNIDYLGENSIKKHAAAIILIQTSGGTRAGIATNSRLGSPISFLT